MHLSRLFTIKRDIGRGKRGYGKLEVEEGGPSSGMPETQEG